MREEERQLTEAREYARDLSHRYTLDTNYTSHLGSLADLSCGHDVRGYTQERKVPVGSCGKQRYEKTIKALLFSLWFAVDGSTDNTILNH